MTTTVAEEEQRLRQVLEDALGGTVVSLERQARWRSAWYADVERDGTVLPLYVRGDKNLDAEPFPGLDREAAILRVLEAGGLPVPHVHAMSEDPVGIVMDRSPGGRDVSAAASDAERVAVAEEHIELLARMHALDVAPFVAAGLTLPGNDAETALAFLDANEPLYRRTRRRPEPLVEFTIRWLRRNVPPGRPSPRFLHCDAGQFLFQDGRITALYDFEASHLGDPLADLAALRMRHGFEPLGAEVPHLFAHYERVTGAPVDRAVVSFHTVTFALAAVMALAGPLVDPGTQAQAEYLVWDLMCRRALVWALAECVQVDVPQPAPLPETPSRQAPVARFLEQTLERLRAADPLAEHDRGSAQLLAAWLTCLDRSGPALLARDLARTEAVLGTAAAHWQEADGLLEELVLQAGPERDRELVTFFAEQLEDQVLAAVPLRERLAGYALTPMTDPAPRPEAP